MQIYVSSDSLNRGFRKIGQILKNRTSTVWICLFWVYLVGKYFKKSEFWKTDFIFVIFMRKDVYGSLIMWNQLPSFKKCDIKY